LAISFLQGPARYVPRGQWRPIPALIAALVVVLVAYAAAVLTAFVGTAYFTGVPVENFGERELNIFGFIAAGPLAFAVICSVWLAAGFRGSARREVLQIDGPMPGLVDVTLAIVGLILAQVLLLGLFYLYDPEWLLANYRSDIAPFVSVMHDPNASVLVPTVLVLAIVAAPLSEEFLFRGFLMSALAKWKWGFWPPAILCTVLWTALHGYSVTGTLGVALYGLYFSWLVWRTGRLWLSLIAHAFANVWAMAAVAFYAWG
jgi:membrane protease YdiL (CAAX protease family)